ncbi:hypothetical protein ABIC75_003666 [Dyella japonica]|uniref:Uncharacterized protein n=1 Tax=Dyella japonica TaxID=231455 RepID=A0ABV2K1L0_9GAMM
MKLHVIYGGVILLLLGAIAYLLYRDLDRAITLGKRDLQMGTLEVENRQLLSAFSVLARDKTKNDVVSAMTQYGKQNPYEKHGCVWVGNLVMEFSPEQKLVNVSPTMFSGEPAPCFLR